MATIFMSVFGKEGLRELAEHNVAKARYLQTALERQGASRVFSGAYFNEFVVRPRRSPAEVNRHALDGKIIGGLELGRFFPELDDALLVCATETNRREEIDRYAAAFA